MSNVNNGNVAVNTIYNKLHALNVLRARKLAAQGAEVKQSMELRRGKKKDGTLEKIVYNKATIVLSPSVLRASAARDGADVLDAAGMTVPYSGSDALVASDVWHGAEVPPATHVAICEEMRKELAFAERVDSLFDGDDELEDETVDTTGMTTAEALKATATENRANAESVRQEPTTASKPEKNGKPEKTASK